MSGGPPRVEKLRTDPFWGAVRNKQAARVPSVKRVLARGLCLSGKAGYFLADSPVFVTGSNGFVGSHLARTLIERGHKVRGLIRPSADRSLVGDLPIEWIEGDLHDHDALRRGCQGANHVIHVAGRVKAPDMDAYRETNVLGTANLLEAAATNPDLERFVYVSSLAAGGPSPRSHPRTESDLDNPSTPYGKSKSEGELLVMECAGDMPVTSVRPPAVYGPGDTEVLGFFQAVNWHIKPLFGSGNARVSMVHVSDLVEGIILACFSPNAVGEVFYIAERDSYDIGALEDIMQEALGTWAVRVRIPRPLLMGIAGMSEWFGRVQGFTPKLNRHKARDFLQVNWTCSIDKAQRLLGYESRIPFARGARQTVEWYRAKGWL